MKPNVEIEAPLSIAKAARPDGYGGEYLFVTTAEGDLWKARLTPLGSGAISSISVSVSPCDANGRAMKRDDAVLVGEAVSHSFTEAEVAADDFDLEARILRLVEARIAAATAQFAVRDQIVSLADALTKPEVTE